MNIINLAYRFLYLLLFIGLMAPMWAQSWDYPTTMPFLGALVCLLLPMILSKRELFEDIYVHKCTLVNLEVGVPLCTMLYLFVHS